MPPSITGTVLVVEDDVSVRDAVNEFLSQHGFIVHVAGNGQVVDRHLSERTYNLVILDLMLPGEDGLSICRRLTARGIPVLMVSALGSTDDRITGLNKGASDYLAKPFEPRELLARVKAILRRRGPDAIDPVPCYIFRGFRYDPADALLSDANGNLVTLTAGEIRLLGAFLERPGRLLSRDMLLDLTHGDHAGPFDRAIDLAVSRLRRKLKRAEAAATIETVRGLGYRFVAPVSRA
ncbi:DNA-binding response regulator [Sphingomonas psychrotolerans]|uniref:DNA-binding response regulator n=2 Tax=Sphingomonas psychrotolerans TaxID=1327635 RepID=A0A2K8MSD1_9SPHN|nr:DNA-binding response regulator [Sphingomonas psychrotolerans]